MIERTIGFFIQAFDLSKAIINIVKSYINFKFQISLIPKFKSFLTKGLMSKLCYNTFGL